MDDRAVVVGLVLILAPIPLCLILAILRGYSITVHMTRKRDGA